MKKIVSYGSEYAHVLCNTLTCFLVLSKFSVLEDAIMMQFASSLTHNTHSLRAPRSVIAIDTLLRFAWLFLSVSCFKRCGVVEVRPACVCFVTELVGVACCFVAVLY